MSHNHSLISLIGSFALFAFLSLFHMGRNFLVHPLFENSNQSTKRMYYFHFHGAKKKTGLEKCEEGKKNPLPLILSYHLPQNLPSTPKASKYSKTCLKRTCSKADTWLKRTKYLEPAVFWSNPHKITSIKRTL